jgi:hypothetical protein
VAFGFIVVVLTALFFDPARVGLHEFYRSRITRCYLGASNTDATKTVLERVVNNRMTSERPGDDLRLQEMTNISRPIHLVCCAANDLSGDPLGNLYRGARSSVLSGSGISLGDESSQLDELRLSSALTASAAAFNSQMGKISMKLGFPVMFLMSALNLRLGLWVPHPANYSRTHYIFPGLFFLKELIGVSGTNGKYLHLSDGGHFENLALYELIRRHCRYIIISDCGADPDVIFDDLANVQRRVREDFGVEVELDVNPLRPDNERLSKQHAVVGTVHYDGLNGFDKGTIIYFKPTLTGDEPADILQYRCRNRTFPHESTTDQFYDEAQWESYRRLGEHAAKIVLGFLETPDPKNSNFVDKLFLGARKQWQPLPDHQQEVFLELTGRCAELERDLISNGPLSLRSEFFSEVAELGRLKAARLQNTSSHPLAPSKSTSDIPLKDDLDTISYLMCVLQIMEDVWVGADFKQYWSHPLNNGWMNYFQRWASTPSLRRWWPILSPVYGHEFREAAKERFGLGLVDIEARAGSERQIIGAHLTLRQVDKLELKDSYAWRQYLSRHAEPDLTDKVLFGYDLQLLPGSDGMDQETILIGFALAKHENNGNHSFVTHWQANELFIPHALHGGGISARFLDALINYHQKLPKRPAQLRASLQKTNNGNMSGSAATRPWTWAERYECVQQIEFYKSRGFIEDGNDHHLELILELK